MCHKWIQCFFLSTTTKPELLSHFTWFYLVGLMYWSQNYFFPPKNIFFYNMGVFLNQKPKNWVFCKNTKKKIESRFKNASHTNKKLPSNQYCHKVFTCSTEPKSNFPFPKQLDYQNFWPNQPQQSHTSFRHLRCHYIQLYWLPMFTCLLTWNLGLDSLIGYS